MATHCRPAQTTDIDDLNDLFQSATRKGMPFSKRQDVIFQRFLEEDLLDLLVVEKDEYVVACCHCAVIPTLAHGGRPFAVLSHLLVDPLNRRQGLARLLFEFALDYVRKKGSYVVYAPVEHPKPWIDRMLKALGARCEGECYVFGGQRS
ncbi:GNAT family N-acetyltransferase [Reinekea blandensis]|uniref:Short chain dehydrogenase n=1 Tax=Reinekea blandensis MED297 TaxID=314283 RepID=A4BGR9_9GAMM|nr:GNAT family N-acetyltransferase [Reinekea blandensis]EAR08717.1 short chain dehydrogenase [Reinekea sp. MED297] [Reinekea blandensis MED297]